MFVDNALPSMMGALVNKTIESDNASCVMLGSQTLNDDKGYKYIIFFMSEDLIIIRQWIPMTGVPNKRSSSSIIIMNTFILETKKGRQLERLDLKWIPDPLKFKWKHIELSNSITWKYRTEMKWNIFSLLVFSEKIRKLSVVFI